MDTAKQIEILATAFLCLLVERHGPTHAAHILEAIAARLKNAKCADEGGVTFIPS